LRGKGKGITKTIEEHWILGGGDFGKGGEEKEY